MALGRLGGARRRGVAALLLALGFGAGLPLPAAAEVPVPALASRVTDLTATLSREQAAALEQRLAALEQQKGAQLAVLLVPTTEPESIEQYALRVAEAWKLGRGAAVDDGVLFLVAKDDRRARIEVGYGLEGAIPDAIAKRILAETVRPRFREGDYVGGIDAGVSQLIGLIQGEPLPPPQKPTRQRPGKTLEQMLGIGLFVLFGGGLLARALGEFPAALGASGLYGLIVGVLMGTLVAGGLAALLMFFIALLIYSSRGRDGFDGGGWGSGGGGSGGWGSGGSFSGGGGGFGGGGASVDW